MKKFIRKEMRDIVQLVALVDVTYDEGDDGDDGLEAGEYAFDSLGGFWQKKHDISEIIAMLDMDEPQRRQERNDARARWKKKSRRQRKDA